LFTKSIACSIDFGSPSMGRRFLISLRGALIMTHVDFVPSYDIY